MLIETDISSFLNTTEVVQQANTDSMIKFKKKLD